MMKTSVFKVSDFFDIRPTKSYKMTNRKLMSKDGHVPVLTNTSTNNGIGGWSSLEPTEKGPMITFSDTTTGPDTVFVQMKPFIGYSHVQGLYSNTDHKWTELELLYFVIAMRAGAGTGWSYATKFNRKLVSNFDIELPVTPTGEPDFEYMTARIRELEAERIRELEAERIRELEAYLHVTGLDDTTLSEDEIKALKYGGGQVNWKKFKIGEFFKVLPAKHKLIKRELLSSGQYPCYSSDTSNYGILGYTNNPEFHIDDKHSYLIFGDHTRSMRIVESDFSVLDNVKVLCGQKLSKEKLLFIETMWHKAIPNLGYARHWSVAKNVDFLLPVTPTGSIDFNYMQNYIRAMEKQTIKGVVEYKDRVIEETKKVVNG